MGVIALFGPWVVGIIYCETRTDYVMKSRPKVETKVVDVTTTWNVTWYSLNRGDERYESILYEVKNVTKISEDWRDGFVVGENKDYVGFKAIGVINVPNNKLAVSVTLGADDYAWVYVDNVKTLELGERALGQQPYRDLTQSIPLFAGKHTVRVEYKEIQGFAKLVFEMDNDVQSWKETITITMTENYQEAKTNTERRIRTITVAEYIYYWITQSIEGQSNCKK